MPLPPSLNFTKHNLHLEDMLVKNSNHDRSLYYIRYIGLTKIERIQNDLGPTLSIMPTHLLQFLPTLVRKLLPTITTIHGFNAHNSRSMVNVCLKCQLDDLKAEVAFDVIDVETSYNLLFGTTMDSFQSNHFIHPSPVFKVCG